MQIKRGPSHNILGLHGSPQCSFLRWSGTYDGVMISGSGAPAIGSYSSEVDFFVDVGMLLLSMGCVVSGSSLETISTCGVSLPPRSRIGGIGGGGSILRGFIL